MSGRYLLPMVALFALFSLLGCCSYLTENGNQSGQANNANHANQTAHVTANRAPVVNLTLKNESGPTPFALYYTYLCYDPDGNLVSCELRIDGKTYAKGADQSSLFPKNYTYPDFYWNATEEVGNHSLEMYAVDAEGLNASKRAAFEVLKGLRLTDPGWYRCNGKTNPPCDLFQESYCQKFTPLDLDVRRATSQAISKHPGAFSLNQLLDIYDWVHANVFYQNVPIDLWPPYYPNETLSTGSGDCKNQAVLIASMVEAAGGSARVLYIPECRHAFAEVYLGNDSNVNELDDAIWAHYSITSEQYRSIRWHTSRNAKNETENWFIFDTAGGTFPGDTIADCLNASQTFELRDCSDDALKAPEIGGTAFGPYVEQNDTRVVQAGYGWSYSINRGILGTYSWCHNKVTVESLSSRPLDWYLTDETGYQGFHNNDAFSYYYGEEQVQKSEYEFDWNKKTPFYVNIRNSNDKSITMHLEIISTCYK
ncbi:MAG: transglutaminase-like domain-containing protein [Candidatus ainarchaeum sp.]|nr:transglutaminase-like domain-containing protein [Candidatus ainarchaeum sp.]